MKRVSFGVTSVQKGRRLTPDNDLLQNLGIKEGDPVELLLDTKEEAIVVKKSAQKAKGKGSQNMNMGAAMKRKRIPK